MTTPRWLVTVTLAGLAAALGVAAESGGQQAALDPFKPKATGPSGPTGAAGKVESRPGVISSIQFVDAPITAVFTMVSDLTGWSIIMSPQVSLAPPKVNIWIKDMAPETVLERVCAIAGLVMERKGTTIEVATFDEYAQSRGTEQKVIQLKFAVAREVVDLLKPYADKNSQTKILANESGNKVVLLVPKTLLESFERLVAALDVPFEADRVEIVRLNHLEALAVGPVLEQFLTKSAVRNAGTGGYGTTSSGLGKTPTAASPEGGALKAGESYLLQFMIEPRLNAIVLRGSAGDVTRAVELIAKLDVPTDIKVVSYELKCTAAASAYKTLSEIIRAETSGGGAGRQTLTPRLKVAISEQNNRIVVEGTPADQVRLAEVIAAIDQPLPAGTGSLRVYRLENTSSAEVVKVIQDLIADKVARSGLARESSGALSNGVGGIHRVAPLEPLTVPGMPAPPAPAGELPAAVGDDSVLSERFGPKVTEAPKINAVIIRGSATDQEEFGKVISELDRPRDQVLLEVTLIRVRSTRAFDLGIQIAGAHVDADFRSTTGASPAFRTQSINFTNFGIGPVDSANGQMSLAAPPPFGLNLAVFNSDDFQLILNALNTVGEVYISSTPKILVEDNTLANLSQTEQQPFEVTSQGESSTITSFGGFVDAGTSLIVTPHLTNEHWLRLEYDIILSSFGVRPSPTLPPPRFQNAIKGTVRVPAEHTVVLGGLVATQKTSSVSGVPGAMDVPVLGHLFKDTRDDSTTETLFVFIRPVMMRDPKFRDLMYMSEDDLRRAKLAQEEFPSNPLQLLTPAPRCKEGVQ